MTAPRISNVFSPVTTLCCLLSTAMFLAGPAFAQSRGVGGMGAMRGLAYLLEPDFNRRDIVQFNDDLSLDGQQQMIVQTLFAGYDEAFQAARADLDEIMRRLRPERSDDDGERQRAREQMRERWQSLRQQMELARDPSLSEEARDQIMEIIRRRGEEMRDQARQTFGPQIEPEELERLTADAADKYKIFRAEKVRLRDQFVGDLLLVLRDDQRSPWPSLERRLIRQKTIPRGQLSGERVDLFDLVRAMGLKSADSDAVAPVLQEYEVTLDIVLRDRNTYLEESRVQSFSAMMQRDGKRALSLYDGEMVRRMAVRDVNEQYASSVAETLPEDVGDTFVRSYRERAYGRVYRKTAVQRAFEAVANFDDLDVEIAGAVAGLQEVYEVELAVRNEQLMNLIKSEEPKQRRRFLERMASGNFGRDQTRRREDRTREQFQARREFDQRYREQLAAMLTPAQVERLPKIQEQRRRDRGERWRGSGEGRGGRRGRAGDEGSNRRGG
ncbi:MAG: hypothetical protein V3T53_06785 [Phycisphaerales bacterium]